MSLIESLPEYMYYSCHAYAHKLLITYQHYNHYVTYVVGHSPFPYIIFNGKSNRLLSSRDPYLRLVGKFFRDCLDNEIAIFFFYKKR